MNGVHSLLLAPCPCLFTIFSVKVGLHWNSSPIAEGVSQCNKPTKAGWIHSYTGSLNSQVMWLEGPLVVSSQEPQEVNTWCTNCPLCHLEDFFLYDISTGLSQKNKRKKKVLIDRDLEPFSDLRLISCPLFLQELPQTSLEHFNLLAYNISWSMYVYKWPPP